MPKSIVWKFERGTVTVLKPERLREKLTPFKVASCKLGNPGEVIVTFDEKAEEKDFAACAEKCGKMGFVPVIPVAAVPAAAPAPSVDRAPEKPKRARKPRTLAEAETESAPAPEIK